MNNQSTIVDTAPTSKLIWSSFGALIFVLVSLPIVYAQTSRIVTTSTYDCPTPGGKILHAAVFFAINYLIMKIFASMRQVDTYYMSDALMAKYAFYATLLFLVISSSDTYKVTGNLVPGIADPTGCPTVTGVLVHGLVFLVILFLMMYFPKDI
jgi:hypothetical protein